MDRQQLRDAQSPLKEKYRNDPASAVVTLRASGTLGEDVSCNVNRVARSRRRAFTPQRVEPASPYAPGTCSCRRWWRALGSH